MNSTAAISPSASTNWNAIWALGFRPFFLAGAFFALALMGLWIGFLAGLVDLPSHYSPINWHAHEMIFGFTLAIIAGFILTASQNWSGVPGVSGVRLLGLTALWAAGRIAPWIAPGWPTFAIDVAFIPVLMWTLVPYLWRPDQKRNRIFFILLTGLLAANVWMHLEAMAIVQSGSRNALLGAVYLTAIMIAVVGGRVIPFFTEKAIAGAISRRHPLLERSVIVGTFVLTTAVVWNDSHKLTGVLALVMALLHALRWVMWRPWQAWRVPILLILFIGYAWIFIGFALHGAFALGLFATSTLAVHALTTGALGIVVYAMITRVSLGHTGRPIRADGWIVAGYAAITLAAVLRVLIPAVFATHVNYTYLLRLSGALWGIAYFLFLLRYTPILLAPRPDNKPG